LEIIARLLCVQNYHIPHFKRRGEGGLQPKRNGLKKSARFGEVGTAALQARPLCDARTDGGIEGLTKGVAQQDPNTDGDFLKKASGSRKACSNPAAITHFLV